MSQPVTSGFSFGTSGGYEFEIIIGIIILFGIFRGLTGRKYALLRVLRTPVIYTVLTLIAVFLTSINDFYAQIMIVLLPIGIPVGIRFGKDVTFFMKNGTLYYKRSPYLLLIWAFALIARVSIELFSFQSLLAVIIFNALLSFITGMLMGEAIHILRTDEKEKARSGSVFVESIGK